MPETDNMPPVEKMPEIGSRAHNALCKQNELTPENTSHGGHRKGAGRKKLTPEQKATQKNISPVNKKQNGKIKNGYRKLVNLVPKSIERLSQMLNSGDDPEALKAIQTIFQRVLPEVKEPVSTDKPVMIVYLPEKSTVDLWQKKAKEVLEVRARRVDEDSEK